MVQERLPRIPRVAHEHVCRPHDGPLPPVPGDAQHGRCGLSRSDTGRDADGDCDPDSISHPHILGRLAPVFEPARLVRQIYRYRAPGIFRLGMLRGAMQRSSSDDSKRGAAEHTRMGRKVFFRVIAPFAHHFEFFADGTPVFRLQRWAVSRTRPAPHHAVVDLISLAGFSDWMPNRHNGSAHLNSRYLLVLLQTHGRASASRVAFARISI